MEYPKVIKMKNRINGKWDGTWKEITIPNPPTMKILGQQDHRWNNEKIGKTQFTIGKIGCLTTCISMAISKFTGDYPYPDQLSRILKYDNRGILSYNSDFSPLKYVGRFNYLSIATVEKYANSTDKAVILQINNGAHFVIANRVENSKIIIYDPWLGDECEVYSRYKKVTGMRLFELA